MTWSKDYPEIFITRFKRAAATVAAATTAPSDVAGGDSGGNSNSGKDSDSEELLSLRQDRFLGPFVDSTRLEATLELVKSCLPLRQLRWPVHAHKPCLNYDIGRCALWRVTSVHES